MRFLPICAVALLTLLPSAPSPASEAIALDALSIIDHVASARALASRALVLEPREGGFAARPAAQWQPLLPTPPVRLPARVGEPLRLTDPLRTGSFVEVRALAVGDVRAVHERDTLVHPAVAKDVDVVRFATARGYEELRVVRSSAAPRAASYELKLGGAFAEARLVGGKVQVVDEGGQLVVESPAARAWDLDGAEVAVEVTLRGVGPRTWNLMVSMSLVSARYPVVVDPAWEYVGPIPAASVFSAQGRSASLLPDGRVLVAGGLGYDAAVAEIIHADSLLFDPKSGAVTKGPDMPGPRWDHVTATASPAGVVLAGGSATSFLATPPAPLASVLLYKLSTNSFVTMAGTLQRAHQGGTAVTMADGRVLVIGGSDGSALRTVDVVEPATGKVIKAPSMSESRIRTTGLLLPDGRVLVAGGSTDVIELFDPATNTWTLGPKAPAYLDEVGLHPLPSGKLLVVPMNLTATNTTYVLDAKASTIAPFAPMKVAHPNGASVRLLDGRILVTGGEKGGRDLRDAEIFDEASGTWTATEPMDVPRSNHELLALPDGRVFISHSVPGLFNVALGGKCDQDAVCASGTCADGRCCATACDGRCTACDVPGREGTCSPVTGKEHARHATCAPYSLCDAGKCASKCAADADCATGNVCYASGTCAPPRATCDGDHTVTDKETGRTVDCAPYRCLSAGDCAKSCTASTECALGAACLDGRCVASATAAEDGGCAVGGPARRTPVGAILGLLASAWLVARRRRTGGLLAAALAVGAIGCGAEPTPTQGAAPLRIETPAATLASFPRIAETMTGPWERTYAALDAKLPRTPLGALVVARSDRPDASLEIVAEDDAAVRVTVSQGWTVHAAARPSTDVFYAIGSQRAEEIRILADRSAATTTSYRVKLGPSIARVRVQGHRFEALDDEGRVLLESEPVWAQDHRGVVRDGVLTAELVGPRTARLTATFDTAGLTFPVALDPAWRATGLHQGSMLSAAAAQLDSGCVVTLTNQITAGLPHAQLYDAVAGEWRTAGTPALPVRSLRRCGLAPPARCSQVAARSRARRSRRSGPSRSTTRRPTPGRQWPA
ncbi:MAG: hypothetical protein IPJ34_42930 [Myxococcales bacterium]|nr:hypothetical protein [Myxococcales bacterium]